MYPTIVFFLALVITVLGIVSLVNHVRSNSDTLWHPISFLIIGCIFWSWLYYLSH